MELIHKEKPKGVIVQYGGQTPLKLARDLEADGAPIIGTTPDSIDLAEDREQFSQLLDRIGLKQAPSAIARTDEEAINAANATGMAALAAGGGGALLLNTRRAAAVFWRDRKARGP